MKRFSENILDSIGSTPLVSLDRLFGSNRNVYAKMEGANPAGSMKDRTSKNIIESLLLCGKISRGSTIVESSSGNMAVGLAQVCKFYGLELIIVVDLKLNPHVRKMLQAYGATIDTVTMPLKVGGFLAARLQRVSELLDIVPNSCWSNQYGNNQNPMAYTTLMDELTQALPVIDYLFVATSTCGSIMGCADYIADRGMSTKTVAVDAVGSVLFGGHSAPRSIPGHGASIASQFLDRKKIHDVVTVDDHDCVKGCNMLLEREAILGGGSMGALVSAFGKIESHIPENSISVLLFADRGERYLDTIFNPAWVADHIDRDSHTRKGANKEINNAILLDS
ncbi:2,3-diaminopropionate biosynthesis protein SbnA [Ulvibacterium marinum]|uniref:N-(2-amino-2-carboxyethyl)-L-glutamate synthase n=1 Tax=Ulvibacterium marinum TaxID=2419782 RepID=A0A3B0CGZ6_9FLAO|nr:2,3-diaminopropionate biosynthesis protein SbnA [Ulvibacterium marinum]RKN83497.1 2,3-diaminopropionate biosynthesis protein SbnA [Ulvibacterium marinum]